MSLYMSSGEQGRPCVRVQGWVDVLCLLPSPKLSRLPSCPQRGFQLQTSLRPDKVVTALLLGLWIHSRVGRGFAGTLAEGQNANRALGVLVQVKHVAFQRVAPHTPHHWSCFLHRVFSKSSLLLQCPEQSSVKCLSIQLKSSAPCFQCCFLATCGTLAASA